MTTIFSRCWNRSPIASAPSSMRSRTMRPGQIRGLQEYEFMDQQAAADFRALLDQLQQQVMQQTFEGMQQSLSRCHLKISPRWRR